MTHYKEDGFDKYNPDLSNWIREMIEKGGTLTGRVKTHLPESQRLKSILPTNVRDPKGVGEDVLEGLHMSLDFSEIESRTVAYIVSVRGGKITILEQLTPEQFYRGYSADLMIIDEYAEMIKMPEPSVELKDKPVKQNGRSASYLQHDRTKQHKLKKPVKRRR